MSAESKRFVSNLDKTIEPRSYYEASLNPEWVKAMNQEIEALYRTTTWIITNLPKNRKPIGCRWIDYEETFAPISKNCYNSHYYYSCF